MSNINPGVGSGGSGGGGAVTVADGADVVEGITTDAAVVAGSTGTLSGKLRTISADISSVKANTNGSSTAANQVTEITSLSSIVTNTTSIATAANQTTMNTNLASIVTNTGNGATSANQTNGTQQTKITDGTNVANVLAADTGFNSVPTLGGVKTIAFTTSSSGAQMIAANTDIRGYTSIEVVYTSVGSGLALTGQFTTASGGTYVNSSTFATTAGGTPAALGVTVNTIYYSAIHGNYFQINVSALVSGTFTGTITLRSGTIPYTILPATQSGTWTVGANSATGSALPANAFSIGGYDGTNLRAISVGTAGILDIGLAPARTTLNTYSIHLTSNATTTPTSSTAYISSITISNEVGGTTSTITIQDKQGTPLKLVNGIATTALTTAPTVINFQTPVKMVSGIDIITAGAVAATVDVWINYYQ